MASRARVAPARDLVGDDGGHVAAARGDGVDAGRRARRAAQARDLAYDARRCLPVDVPRGPGTPDLARDGADGRDLAAGRLDEHDGLVAGPDDGEDAVDLGPHLAEAVAVVDAHDEGAGALQHPRAAARVAAAADRTAAAGHDSMGPSTAVFPRGRGRK